MNDALKQVLLQLGQSVTKNLGDQFGALANPHVFQQQQENQRQNQQLAAQQTQHSQDQAQSQQNWQQQFGLQQQSHADEEARWAQQLQSQKDQHAMAASQWALSNQDKVETAQPNEPGAFQVGAGWFKPRHEDGPTDLITLSPEALKEYGLSPAGTGPLKAPLKDMIPLLGHLADVRGKRELKATEAAQVAQSAKGLHSFVDNYVAKEDPAQAMIFKTMIDNAGSDAELKGIGNSISTYNESHSPAARRRHQNEVIATVMGEYAGKRAAEKKENEEAAGPMFDFMIKTGTLPNLILSNFDKSGKKDIIQKWIRDKGVDALPTWLSGDAMKGLTELDNTEDLGKRMKAFLEKTNPDTNKPFKDSDNPIGDVKKERLMYWLGKDSDLAPLITEGELFDNLAAARLTKAAGVRANEFVENAKIHTPQPSRDSFKLMYHKLTTIQDYFKGVRKNIIKNGNKWGMVGANGIDPDSASGQQQDFRPPLVIPPPPSR